jgi:ElaB/YqjD/DUF883 family membrane-anchored ribosome-binding protein
MTDFQTTNLILGIMAAVSVLQFLMLITALIIGLRAYRRLTERFDVFEQERLAPIADKAQAVMQDVQRLTSQVATQTERVEQALSQTAERFEERAERVKAKVHRRVMPMVAAAQAFKDAMRQNGTSHSAVPLSAEGRLAAARAAERGEPWPAETDNIAGPRESYWAGNV